MAQDITTGEARTAFSTQSLTQSEMTVLARGSDPAATFTEGELALIRPIAGAIAVRQIAEERTIRQSIGSLSASMPSKNADAQAGKLQLATYISMLSDVDERALASACRSCLDDLDWFPTVHQIKQRIAAWVSPETRAIRRAQFILRNAAGRAHVKPPIEITAFGIRAMKTEHRAIGIAEGFITQADVDAALADQVEPEQQMAA